MNARVLLATVLFIFLAGMHQSVPRAAEEDARLNLRDAELPAFIELVARITGRNFIVDPRVRGTVTVIAPEPMTPDAIYTIFLNVLQINGYAIVEGDGADRIVPVQLARQLPPRVEGQAQGPARAAGFVTRIVKVENMPLDEAMEVIRPLLPAEAALSPIAPDACSSSRTARPTSHESRSCSRGSTARACATSKCWCCATPSQGTWSTRWQRWNSAFPMPR